MKIFRALLPALWLALLVASTGCHTTPRVNWDARIGAYTYDQAVADMGPPSEQSTLDGGVRVAQWVTGRVANATAMPVGGGWGPGGGFYAPGPVIMNSSITQYLLRLTFGADGQLQAWKRVVQ